MTHRSAAIAARELCYSENIEVVKLGFNLLRELAEKDCYHAKLSLIYFYDRGGPTNIDPIAAQKLVNQASEMHSRLTDSWDLYDAGMKCMWDSLRFATTKLDAIKFWNKAALLGNGDALYAICDATRNEDCDSLKWIHNLELSAKLGCTQAMVEFAERLQRQGSNEEILWLEAAATLGNLRAKEMLER